MTDPKPPTLQERLRSGAMALRNYDDPQRVRITIRAALLREVAADAEESADALDKAERQHQLDAQTIASESSKWEEASHRLREVEQERDQWRNSMRGMVAEVGEDENFAMNPLAAREALRRYRRRATRAETEVPGQSG